MPGRGINGSYRYGFNGKENDKEVVGTGQGTQDYGMWIYNPSLGKFLSVDPLTKEYPDLTPYQFASNCPISGKDRDGEELDWVVMDAYMRAASDNGTTNVSAGDILVGAVNNLVDATKANVVEPWANRYMGLYTGPLEVAKADAKSDDYNKHADKQTQKIFNTYQKLQGIANTAQALVNMHEDGIQMASMVLGPEEGLLGFEAKGTELVGMAINPEKILFSQKTVNGLEEIAVSMKKSGWKGPSIDVVDLGKGMYGTVDNTRLLASHEAKIDVSAIVHQLTDAIPEETAKRFLNKKGAIPTTWGEAYGNRIEKQGPAFKKNNPQGSYHISAND
jgi:RHS repeat-associated protein